MEQLGLSGRVEIAGQDDGDERMVAFKGRWGHWDNSTKPWLRGGDEIERGGYDGTVDVRSRHLEPRIIFVWRFAEED
jgi:hypothetical protein